ncbi:MAG: hypothetical protein KA310_13700 [Pseudomonadales bacterium]|nr:hypothetical protein [Pseudomonadales bacterium]
MHAPTPATARGFPTGTGAAPRLGVITNPHSGRNRRQLAEVRRLLEASGCVRHIVTEDSAAIPGALAAFAEDGIGIVGINGGDGSVAHVLTALMHASPFASPPLLCALPGGTTNVTVGDVGIRGGLCESILKLLGWMHRGDAPGDGRAAPRDRRARRQRRAARLRAGIRRGRGGRRHRVLAGAGARARHA